ncbi:hypothetical protein Ddc_10770 [Ditylenchus destructor]|nr:hypothetical protein Ddc_10770 [Ditylenchus destructor]
MVHSHKNLPLNQHFVRLVADPNIYICNLILHPQNDVLHLLANAIETQGSKLQCKWLKVSVGNKDGEENFISRVKNHVRCYQLDIYHRDSPCKYDDDIMLDLFLNGALMTPAILASNYDFSNIVVDLVQKFLNLKECDQFQLVPSIRSYVAKPVLEVLKHHYAPKEPREGTSAFEFINNNILKKLEIIVKISDKISCSYSDDRFSLNINNL